MVHPIPSPDPSAILLSPHDADEWDHPVFAFHDLDYIPSGYSGILAPYIETGPGTMRAAAALMRLDVLPALTPRVVCDLGCGDGEFLIGLLRYVNARVGARGLAARGLGVDYDAQLIETAARNAVLAGVRAEWLTYDFNEDRGNLVRMLLAEGVTHVFVYLVPKQLALAKVRGILEGLWGSGVVVCCHKFQPGYLGAVRTDVLMDLMVYEKIGDGGVTLEGGKGVVEVLVAPVVL